MTEVTLHGVPSGRVLAVVDRARPYLERIADLYAWRMTPVDVLARILRGEWQLWLLVEEGRPPPILGAIVTQIIVWPGGKEAVICGLAGKDATRWVHDTGQRLEAWARAQGCRAIEAPGRLGWHRMARAEGWAKTGTVWRKEF